MPIHQDGGSDRIGQMTGRKHKMIILGDHVEIRDHAEVSIEDRVKSSWISW